MPQTYQSPVRVYKYPFELVMKAYHKRFPTCPQIPIFIGSDIIYEYHSPDEAEEIIERKCTLNVEAPYLLKKVAGIDYVYFMQRNHLNLRERTLNIEASNISFSSRIAIVENCRYYVHAENPEWTCFEQSASLDVKSFFGFESTVEKIAVKQYAANIAKGKEILEFFIEDLIKGGVTHVPRWEPPPSSAFALNAANDAVVERAPQAGEPHYSQSDSAIGEGSQHEDEEIKHDPESVRRASSPLVGTSEENMPAEELIRRRSGSQKQQKRSQTTKELSTGANAPITSGSRTRSIDGVEKLESDYIQRFLGQLTPLEESRLCELKYSLQSTHKGKMPNDAHLLRFLRARDYDVKKASQMLLNSLLWRKQHNIDKILHEFSPPEVLLKYLPGAWHHQDIEGRPLYVLCLGKMDIKGLLRTVGLEAVVKFTLSVCEQGLLKAAEATNILGKPISTMSLLVDLEGLSLRHLWRPGIQCLLRIIETVEAHYPETLGLVLVTRAPRVFPVLWTLVSPFIDENTTRKFVFNTERLVLAELEKYIPKCFLPDFLGGPSPFQSPAGCAPGHVPKNQYLPLNEVLRDNEDILQSFYNTAIVSRSTPKESCVWVPEMGSVLTWDFDVIKGDCDFTVYFTEKKIEQPQGAGQTSFSSVEEFPGVLLSAAAEAVDRVTSEVANLLSSSSHPSQYRVVAVAPTLGPESLSVVHETTPFSEGDSMQGSNYCDKAGTYILQWRHPADVKSSHQSPSVSGAHSSGTPPVSTESHAAAAKCRLLYFHEILDSTEFRGSVATLASCRESFSSLPESVSPHAKRQQKLQQKNANAEVAGPSTSTSK